MSEQQQASGWPPAIVAAIITLVGVFIGLEFQSGQFEKKLATDREQFDKKFQKELKDAEDLRNRELEQRAKEFKIKFYENQMAVYKELCQIVSKITIELKGADKDYWRLQELIVGDLSVFADQDVLNATLRFNEHLDNLRKNNVQKMPNDGQRLAFDVSNACRSSLMATFDLTRFGKGIGAFVPTETGK